MSTQDNRFSNKLPAYFPPQDKHGVLQPPQRDSAPAMSLAEQKQNKKVEQLLAQAKALSGQLVEDAKEIKEKRENPPVKVKNGKVRFCPAHILNDREFIKITRSMNIHDKGAMQLLLANGGSEFLERGFLPAQAFDLLRKAKMSAMVQKPNHTFDKRPVCIRGKVYTPGVPTWQERAAKIGMRLVEDTEK